MQTKIIWISWVSHRRSQNICAQLNIPIFELISEHKGLLRYLELSWRTLHLLRAKRPDAVIVMSPSIVLAFMVGLIAPWGHFKSYIDGHNCAILAPKYQRLLNWINRRSQWVIVTNRQLQQQLLEYKIDARILPDAIPYRPEVEKCNLGPGKHLLLICTFADDEPVLEVLEAVAKLNGVSLHVSGNDKKLTPLMRNKASPHVIFTGFLDEDEYWRYLLTCDVIIDLTRRDHCLVCGAYEAIAAGRPAVLTDDKSTRELFSKGVVYSQITSSAIKQAITQALAQQSELSLEVEQLRLQMDASWQQASHQLISDIERDQ